MTNHVIKEEKIIALCKLVSFSLNSNELKSIYCKRLHFNLLKSYFNLLKRPFAKLEEKNTDTKAQKKTVT